MLTRANINRPGPHLKHSYVQILAAQPDKSKPLVDMTLAAKGFVPNLYDHITEVRWDLIIVVNMKEGDGYMSTNKIIPDPTVGFPQWASAMSTCPNAVNLRDYRDHGGKDKRLWLMEGARHITQGMKQRILKSELVSINDEKVNCFEMTESAKEFWKNGREQAMSEQQIVDGWEGMMSIKEDTKAD